MRVLVIGGTLFIGKLLVKRLIAAGHEVTILHRKAEHPFGRKVRNVVADRNDVTTIRTAVSGLKFDAVYDIAYDWERGTTSAQVEATAKSIPPTAPTAGAAGRCPRSQRRGLRRPWRFR